MPSADRDAAGMSEAEIRERAHVARRYLTSLGMPAPALAALEGLLGEAGSEAVRAEIAWLLLGWYMRRGSGGRDLTPLLGLAVWPADDADIERRVAILRSRLLAEDDPAAATALLEAQLAKAPHSDVMLALANLVPLGERVGWYNRAFGHHRLEPVELAAGEAAPFDRLQPAGAVPVGDVDPLVSVIVPNFNAADTIGTALRSLGWQSWARLEIIVVDDASSDDSRTVIGEAARADRRVRLISQAGNRGAYVARNTGLAVAKGEFVTVHDADDWSHPAKIERQVEHLLANPDVIANLSMKVRAHPTLQVVGLPPAGSHVAANASSLMFRREPVLAELGSWDSVRVGADTEFIRRLQARFGMAAVVTLDTGPIALQRRSEGSLTGFGALAYPGFEFGARKEYGENGYWFRKRHGDRLHYPFPMSARPFPAPAPMLPERPVRGAPRRFDVVIASDFRQRSDANVANIEEVEANAALGLATGLVQLSLFDLQAERRRHPWLVDAVEDGRAEMLVFGETIAADLVVIRDPRVLVEEQAYVPEVEAGDVRLIVDRPPLDLRVDPYRPGYDAAACDAHATRLFGRRAIWHPTNPIVRQALIAQGVDRLVQLGEDDWPEIVTIAGPAERAARGPGKPVRIGRHGPDHWSAWPESGEAIRAAYPDGRDPRVSVLGSVDAATRILGETPTHWKVSQGKRREQIGAFLGRLDAYVYFARAGVPQYDIRNVLEAMAAGVPVVLDEAMRPAFGARARYADPLRTRKMLKQLADESEATAAMTDEARRHVEEVHGRAAYSARLRALLG